MLQGYLDSQIMGLSLWHSLVGMKMMRTMVSGSSIQEVLYIWLQIESDNKVLPVYPLHAEFVRPLWGMNSYEFIQSAEQKNLIGCSYRQNGRSYIGILDDSQSTMSILDIPFTDINSITSGFQCLYIEGASAVLPLSTAKVTLDDQKLKAVDFRILWSSSANISKYKSYFCSPELIEFPTKVPGQNAYAYFYPPTNPIYQASQDEKPPLLLKSHGRYSWCSQS